MSTQQTAIDEFIEQLEQKGGAWENANINRIQISIDVNEYLELKRQAKEIHKEQITNSFDWGCICFVERHREDREYKNAEDYYYQKFEYDEFAEFDDDEESE